MRENRLELKKKNWPVLLTNAEFKATLNQYFRDNPGNPPEEKHWVRGIVLSKNVTHIDQLAIGGTLRMEISFLCYVQNGEINEYSSKEFDGLLDLKTPIGADIWIKEWNWNLEVKLISTRATCIPDSCITK